MIREQIQKENDNAAHEGEQETKGPNKLIQLFVGQHYI